MLGANISEVAEEVRAGTFRILGVWRRALSLSADRLRSRSRAIIRSGRCSNNESFYLIIAFRFSYVLLVNTAADLA